MGTISTTDFKNSMIELFTEAYDGPPNPSSTWFIDNEPDSGILGVLEGISAEEASISVDGSGQPGSTISSNAEHLRWSLALSNAIIRAESPPDNWTESWQTLSVGKTEWDRLRSALREEFETLREALRRQDELPGELTGYLAPLLHAAFHLGIIRQMISRVRS